MARKTNLAPAKNQFKPKAITKGPAKAALNVIDFIVPKTPMEVALYSVNPFKYVRPVAGIVGKGARYVSKAYRNIGK